MDISLICAMSENRVIGINGDLPWRMPTDMARFRQLTMGHTVIMGRKTFESIGSALPNRKNIVLTRQLFFEAKGCEVANGIRHALSICKGEKVFIIGGGEIYRQALPYANKMHITIVYTRVNGDAFFPDISLNEWRNIPGKKIKADDNNPYDYQFVLYVKRSQPLRRTT